MKKRILIQLLALPFPWAFRRWLFVRFMGYDIHPSARVGLSLITVDSFLMEENSSVGHFNLIRGLRKLHLGRYALIGSFNWVVAYPVGGGMHFLHRKDRDPVLVLGLHSAITSWHHFDCTDSVQIGTYTTIAGKGSQILTHSLDIELCRQDCRPITVGDFCMVGTKSVLLPGSRLPDKSVLGACSLLRDAFTDSLKLYGGVPAKPIKALSAESKYFHRTSGWID